MNTSQYILLLQCKNVCSNAKKWSWSSAHGTEHIAVHRILERCYSSLYFDYHSIGEVFQTQFDVCHLCRALRLQWCLIILQRDTTQFESVLYQPLGVGSQVCLKTWKMFGRFYNVFHVLRVRRAVENTCLPIHSEHPDWQLTSGQGLLQVSSFFILIAQQISPFCVLEIVEMATDGLSDAAIGSILC